MKSKSVAILKMGTPTDRTWTGRDDNQRNHHGWIPKDQKVITLTIRWKESKQGKVSEVGRFKINLPGLEAEGHVRLSDEGFYLRFQRTDNRIEIAINRSSEPLEVGRWP